MLEARDPPNIVRAGYDAVSFAYRDDDGYGCAHYERWIERSLKHLPPVPDVLELGCGCGKPVAALLASRARYLGVDLSPVQVARARGLVPAGRFLCADMNHQQFHPRSFDLIIALYSIIHLPVERHAAMILRISEWLRPGGVFLATLGHEKWTGTEENWLGVPGATMYWSHADAETYRQWCKAARLEIVVDEFIPEGAGGHQLFQARRAPE